MPTDCRQSDSSYEALVEGRVGGAARGGVTARPPQSLHDATILFAPPASHFLESAIVRIIRLFLQLCAARAINERDSNGGAHTHDTIDIKDK